MYRRRRECQRTIPLRAIRKMVNRALEGLTREFEAMYSHTGRPSIAPEQLLRALLLQVLYSIRSERLLVEQLDYNLLFRWFVALSMDDPARCPEAGFSIDSLTNVQIQAFFHGLLGEDVQGEQVRTSPPLHGLVERLPSVALSSAIL